MSISKNNNKVFSVSLFLQDPININASCFEELYKKIQYKFNLKAHQYFIIQTQFIWDDIPIEFNELDLSNSLHINKTRTVIKYEGKKFEIDKYEGMNIVILEVELNDINEKIEFPKYLEREILYEVTGIKEFSNKRLAK